MERIREEIVSNEEKLHSEVHEITQRLNSIVRQHEKIVRNLKLLNYKDLLTKKDYFLSVTNQQHNTIQLLLSVNLQLEELQNDNKLTLKNAVVDDRTSNKSPKLERKLTKKSKSTKTNSTNNISTDSSALSTPEEVNSTTSSDSVIDATSKHIVEIAQPTNTIEASVLKKLKQFDLLSRKQRYINNLKVPVMPDLSFKRSPATSTANRSQNVLNATANGKESKQRQVALSDISEDSNGAQNNATSDEKCNVLGEHSKSNSSQHGSKANYAGRATKRKLSEVTAKENSENEIFVGEIPQPLEPYVKLQCLISHVKSPSEFYINFADENIEVIGRISADYTQHHDSPEDLFLSKDEAKLKLNGYCLCYVDSWECWYRAKVVDWQEAGTTDDVTVYLVDYGYTLNLTYKNLRYLLKKYAQYPQCAIKCHLAYLFPPHYTIENPTDVWPEESVKTFRDIIEMENDCNFEVVWVENIDGRWAIDLVKPSDQQDDPSIGQRLIEAKVCIEIVSSVSDVENKNGFIKAQLETAQGVHGINSDMSDNEKMDAFCRNTDTKEPGSLDEALVSYKAKDEARTCQIFRRYGTCYKLPNCKFEHKLLREDGFTTDKVEAHIETTLPLSLPTVGQTVDVRISSILNLSSWYGHITSNISTYAQLIESLNDSKQACNYKPFKILPSPGELVIVKTQMKLNWWCRGLVKEVYQSQLQPEEMVQVFLVDTGDVIETKLSELRTIPQNLLYLPFQAVLLKLHGLKEKETDAADAIAYCEHNYVSRIFTAKILHTKPSVLVVTLTKRDVDVRTTILQDGYGEIVEDDVYPETAYPLSFD